MFPSLHSGTLTPLLTATAFVLLPAASPTYNLAEAPLPPTEAPLLSASTKLHSATTLFRESTQGKVLSRRTAPTGSQVKILLSSPKSSLIEWQNHRLWVDNASLAPHKKTNQNQKKFQPVSSAIEPSLHIQKHVPFEITARISSLKHYPTNKQNRFDSISPADFSLVWGPYDSPNFQTSQSHRQGHAKFPPHWIHQKGDYKLFWRNFHLLSNSPEITEKILACQPNDRITLKGFLSSVVSPKGKPLWASSLAMGFCPILLVEDLEIH